MGFLRPAPMVKLGLVGLKDDREAVLSVLHDLRAVQVEPLRKEAFAYLKPETGGELQRSVADQLIRFRGLRAALPSTRVGAPRPIPPLGQLLEEAGKVPIDDEVGRLKREEDHLITEERSNRETAALLERFAFFTEPFEYLRTKHLFAFFGEADTEVYGRLRKEIPALSEALFLDAPVGKTTRFVLCVRSEQAEAVGRLAQQEGVLLSAAPHLTGRAREILPGLETRRAEIDRRLAEIRTRLRALATEWFATVATLEEAFEIEARKLEVFTRMGAGRTTFALEGWIPQRARVELERDLRAVTGGRIVVYPVPTTEEPPTLLDNPPGIRIFELFIRFYSLPQATEWDPTWVFALAFPIFFGLMLADWGYGLTILGISLWMLAGFPGGGKIPRPIRHFVKLILSPRGMQRLAAAIVPGAILAIGLGVVFNEFFGAHALPFTLTPDPLRQVGLLLQVSGYIGLGMVTLGFFLGALKEFFHRHPRAGLARVGGILFAWGIAEIGLAVLRHLSTNPGQNPLMFLFYALLGGGIALLLIGERAQGLMALTEILSHVLSYTRLVGILLASVVLALVINTIAGNAFATGNVVGLVTAIVILVVGQGFNVIIGVFEPGIQGARLIFVEHFSKYFSGNGRAFQPFGAPRTHTAPWGQNATPLVGAPPSNAGR